jgi:hypothetical protein
MPLLWKSSELANLVNIDHLVRATVNNTFIDRTTGMKRKSCDLWGLNPEDSNHTYKRLMVARLEVSHQANRGLLAYDEHGNFLADLSDLYKPDVKAQGIGFTPCLEG